MSSKADQRFKIDEQECHSISDDKTQVLNGEFDSEHSAADEFSGSSSESEEEPPLWNRNDERNFLRTLSALKERDPKIYDSEMRFFKDQSGTAASLPVNEKKKERRENNEKMTLRDYERKLAIERGGQLAESETDEAETFGWNAAGTSSYLEQEKELKQAFKNAYASDSDESGSECLLKKRVKTAEEKLNEEEDYYEWLKDGGEGGPEISDKDLKRLKKRWSKDGNLDEDERFLRDYLLNKEYENGEEGDGEEAERIPTYEELIQEDEDDDMAEQFEQKYNFRFEDPDQEFLKQYPRTVKEALRKPESKRKRKREIQKEERREKSKIAEVDVPFRYRPVVPNSFGLTTEEILNSEDRQLNAWAPVSKMSQYRSDDQEQRQLMYFQRKAQDKEKKQKILQNNQTESKNGNAECRNNEIDTKECGNLNTNKAKKTKRGRLKNGKIEIEQLGMERLKAYGVSTKKLKRVQYVKKMVNEDGGGKRKKRRKRAVPNTS